MFPECKAAAPFLATRLDRAPHSTPFRPPGMILVVSVAGLSPLHRDMRGFTGNEFTEKLFGAEVVRYSSARVPNSATGHGGTFRALGPPNRPVCGANGCGL